MKTAYSATAVLTVSLFLGAAADAGIITYDLHNHPNGGAAPPAYGFRLDGLFNSSSSHIFTFDFNDASSTMKLEFDDVGNTIRIHGLAHGGLDSGLVYADPPKSGLWAIDFMYNANVTYDSMVGGDPLRQAIEVTGEHSTNVGSITPLFEFDDGNALTTTKDVPIGLVDEQGRYSFSFRFNNTEDHRLSGSGMSGPQTFVGYGWVNHSGDPHVYASDWLFTGTIAPDPIDTPVPEPSSIVLLTMGCLGLLGFRRRQLCAA